MTISEARSSLPDLLDRVQEGEEMAITRHGQLVAVVVRPDSLRTRRAEEALGTAERVHELLVTARANPRPAATLTSDRAEELIREVRTGREAR